MMDPEMPTYAYACADCGHAFDIVQSFSDDTLTTCPECDGRLRKQFNAVGVVFKGGGFYRNDSRATTSSTDTAAAKTPAASSNDSSSSTSSSSAGSSSTSSTTSSSSSTAS